MTASAPASIGRTVAAKAQRRRIGLAVTYQDRSGADTADASRSTAAAAASQVSARARDRGRRSPARRFAERFPNRDRERRGIARRHEESGLAGRDQVGKAADRARDHRRPHAIASGATALWLALQYGSTTTSAGAEAAARPRAPARKRSSRTTRSATPAVARERTVVRGIAMVDLAGDHELDVVADVGAAPRSASADPCRRARSRRRARRRAAGGRPSARSARGAVVRRGTARRAGGSAGGSTNATGRPG